MRSARLDAMEQYILQNEEVSIRELLTHFSVSINTLRRDLDDLEARGHVEKKYGGAAARTPASLTPMPKRFQLNMQKKRAIGERAAEIIPDGATVFIDSGSTTYNIIPFLDQKRGLTLVTHSLVALNEASLLKEVNTISLGGIYNASLGAFVGFSALETVKTLSVKIAVMAATGVSIRHGLSNTTYFEAEIKRAVAARAEKVVLLADRTKFGKEALITYCPLERVSTVVTDASPPAEYASFFQKKGIELLCAPET